MGLNLLFCGVTWSEDGTWALEVVDGANVVRSLDTTTPRLIGQVTSTSRFCLGYHDLTLINPQRIPCPSLKFVSNGKQCQACRYAEGFSLIHQYVGPIGALPKQIRAYISQPHYLYIAGYASGDIKVGTAAESRKYARLYEQGAVCAEVVARSSDGLAIRHLEAGVSSTIGLKQSVSSRSKFKGLLRKEHSVASIQNRVHEVAESVRETLVAVDSVKEHWRGGADFLELVSNDTIHEQDSSKETVFGLNVRAALGQALLVCIDDDMLLLDASMLSGRRFSLPEEGSVHLPAKQQSLF